MPRRKKAIATDTSSSVTRITASVDHQPVVVQITNGRVLGTFTFTPEGIRFAGRKRKLQSPLVQYDRMQKLMEFIG